MLLHVNSKTRRCQVEAGTRKKRSMFTSTTCCFLPALQKIESKNIFFPLPFDVNKIVILSPFTVELGNNCRTIF